MKKECHYCSKKIPDNRVITLVIRDKYEVCSLACLQHLVAIMVTLDRKMTQALKEKK
jgi:hypothetical protein